MKEKLLSARSKPVKARIESADCDVWIQPLRKGEFEKAVARDDGDTYAVCHGVVDENGEMMFTAKELEKLDSLVFIELARRVAEVCTKKTPGSASKES